MMQRRMRVRKGRVMHAVETGTSGWLRSVCHRPRPVKGVSGTVPRVEAYAEDWTEDNLLGYPDCAHCPNREEER
jgi:hypothetical protein